MISFANVLPDRRIYASLSGCGTADDTASFATLIGHLATDQCRHIVIDVEVSLPGVTSAASFTAAEIPSGSVIEFTGKGALVFDTDGSVDHDYLRFEGVSDLRLIAPRISNRQVPTTRNARPAIFFKNCDDCHTSDAHISDTSGAGTLIENSRNCSHTRPRAFRTLADGHHITNGATGPSVNCWTYGAHSKDCGDDQVAVVSYDNGVDPCISCGHLDFVTDGGNARGATIIGGIDCKLRGTVYRSGAQGVLVGLDQQYSTHAPKNCHVDVLAVNCGTVKNVAGIEIGRAAVGITGHLKSVGSVNRGISLNGSAGVTSDHELTLWATESGDADIYIESVADSNFPSVKARGAPGRRDCHSEQFRVGRRVS